MAEMRVSRMLPAIKCSDCGAEIEISRMGEHVCKSRARDFSRAATAPTSGPFSQRPSNGRTHLKPSKTMNVPPRIDPSAANKPYLQKNLLTPLSNVSLGSRSPVSPLDSGHPPRPSPSARSMTSPMPRYRQPHSPELSSNLDCAFPAFPTSNARRPSTAGGSKKSAAPHKDEMFGRSPRSVFSEPESMTETSGTEVDSAVGLDRNSPLYGGQQSYQMNRQASGGDSRPGPTQSFGVGRRPSREGTQQNPATVFPLREARPASPSFNSQVPAPYARSAAPGSPMNPKSRAAPSRPQRPAGVDNFLAKLKTDPVQDSNPSVEYLAQGVRSNTFPRPREPRPTHGETSQRRPSEPAYAVQRPPMPHSAKSMPTRDNHMPPVPLRSQTMQSSRSPPRSSSRNGMRSASNDQIVQPPPSTQQMPGMTRAETEHITHASSDSASSTSSAVSAGNSSTRSHISPSSSVSVPSTQDHSPALSSPDPGLYPNDSKNQLYGYEHGLGVTMAPVQEVPQWSPPSRPYATLAAPSTKRGDTRNFTPPQQFPVEHPESPMDPALQRGIVRQPSAPGDFSFTALQTQPSVPQQRSDNVLARSDPTTERRPGTGSKHICRGCNEKIVGKSIKAQDGRLTGRYHRQCFVCKTCHATFATADFYVHNNDPYCEHHYHLLNNSLCTSCDHGIEGQYLETQQGNKFHPSCLTCLTCRTVLSDDYFEISGKVYCERHAFAAVRAQPDDGLLGPKRNMERRTTRLLMM